MFLLVPPYPGCPGSKAVKRSLLLFCKFLKHFQKHRPRADEWCLLVVDGHGSHVKSVESLKFAESNKILLLCLPPHTTHMLHSTIGSMCLQNFEIAVEHVDEEKSWK